MVPPKFFGDAAPEHSFSKIKNHSKRSNGPCPQHTAHTLGGVIGESETIMQIVPAPPTSRRLRPRLLPKTSIRSHQERRRLCISWPATGGATPVIRASLRAYPPTSREQQNSNQPAQAYYTVRIALLPDEIARLHDIRLVPGMPAQVFVHPAPVP